MQRKKGLTKKQSDKGNCCGVFGKAKERRWQEWIICRGLKYQRTKRKSSN
ncbi:hypothetical protein [Caldicellulosiruptor bescii]|nr:hypothetical protein [Caldicellulosiruptor bescii]